MKSWKKFFFSAILCAFIALPSLGFAKEVVIGFSGPLSGPAAEYGLDNVTGIDMAIRELNAAGGITVDGEQYTFKLDRLDDRTDPTQAVSNARRFVSRSNAPVVFNSIATTVGAMMSINQEPGAEFLLVGYSSVHSLHQMGNELLVNPASNFVAFAKLTADMAWKEGYRTCAMAVTLGAYGDAWRGVWKAVWEAQGGTVTGDFPANYYAETDFSSQITAAMSGRPDFMLVGGPSATTALFIEQARGMGFRGGFVLIDQARMDYVARILGGPTLLEGAIGVANIDDFPLPYTPVFAKNYRDTFNRPPTWEAAYLYSTMKIVANAMERAGTVTDVRAIRAAIPDFLPTLGDKYPNESLGITDTGILRSPQGLQIVKNGKFGDIEHHIFFATTEEEYEYYKSLSKVTDPEIHRWVPIQ